MEGIRDLVLVVSMCKSWSAYIEGWWMAWCIPKLTMIQARQILEFKRVLDSTSSLQWGRIHVKLQTQNEHLIVFEECCDCVALIKNFVHIMFFTNINRNE